MSGTPKALWDSTRSTAKPPIIMITALARMLMTLGSRTAANYVVIMEPQYTAAIEMQVRYSTAVTVR